MSARRNLIISAVSNLSTAYNLVVINVVHVIIGYQYCGGPSNCSAEIASASTSCLAGAIVGQLAFGYIGDCLGRPRALQLTMAMSILGALASAFAVPVSSDPASIFVFLTITRFFLGVGVGGVYPLSATIASESSETNARGRNASLVFSMQGVANLLVPLVAWALLQVRPALSRPPTYLAARPPSCPPALPRSRAPARPPARACTGNHPVHARRHAACRKRTAEGVRVASPGGLRSAWARCPASYSCPSRPALVPPSRPAWRPTAWMASSCSTAARRRATPTP